MSMPFDPQPPPPNPNRTNIPAARALIEDAIMFLTAFHPGTEPIRDILNDALSKMRRKPKQNPRTIADKMDRDKVIAILLEHAKRPDATNHEIAILPHINVNAGRVCEVRNGLRTPDNPKLPSDGRNRT